MNKNGIIQAEDLLQLALMKREVSDYKGFNEVISTYLDRYGETEYINSLQKQQDKIEELMQSDEQLFTLLPINDNESTSYLSINYLPNKKLAVSSAQSPFSFIKKIDGWTGKDYYSISIAQIDEQLKLSDDGFVAFQNQKFLHNTSMCYDKKNEIVYFTATEAKNKKNKKNKTNTLKIYRGKLLNNQLVDIELLPFNDNYYSCAYPSIDQDGKTLYFSSNMPGGFGGMDIYAVSLEDDLKTAKPLNLGKNINSPRNEITPHISSQSNTLYFSSNGHLGFGGYDIFVAQITSQGEVVMVKNLGKSINSNRDDVSFVNEDTQSEGFIISNKDGRDRVYKFEQNHDFSPIIINGIIADGNGEPIADKSILFLSLLGDTLQTTLSNSIGRYEVVFDDISSSVLAIISASNDYNGQEKNITLNKEIKTITQDFLLERNSSLSFRGIVTDKEDKQPIDDARILFSSRKNQQLNKDVLSKNQGDFEIVYDSITSINNLEFKITIEKNGYVSKTILLDQLMENNRLVNLNNYFDLSLEKSLFKSNNLKDLIAINNVLFGFDRKDLSSSYKKELDKIVKFMKENPNVKLLIEGHTDTRGPKEYNDKLSLKRASTCFNYLLSQGVDNDRLSIKALGETKPIHSDQVISQQKSSADKEKLHTENRRTEFYISE